jgi:exonuclease VII large subunit
MEEEMDLFYHALNYRGASTQNAELCWQELQACVDRLIKAEREACAKECTTLKVLDTTSYTPEGYAAVRRCAEAIRERSNP